MTTTTRLPIGFLPPARREVVLALRRAGEARAGDLSGDLDISVGAVRQQLTALHSDGLIARRSQVTGPGRPKHFYTLTPAAEALFRHDCDLVTRSLAEFLTSEAPEVLERFIDLGVGRWESLIPPAASDTAVALKARIQVVARWLDGEGFMPEVRPARDGYDVVLHNCPVLALASGTPTLCARTSDGLGKVMHDCDMSRPEWRLAGDRRCTYRFVQSPRP